ncbi:MAG: UDP-N-acetylmuramate dehydrogenase [Candidatus Levybacteria bacterium]|nr:UDP-N-acetylmuramate dehydrogenase [Candidatus Levybacteria bacterium]MDZ4228448.1 UDP-N-acetylmuramate dehydrogenase [Candidatus Levybacteria bacterium]
MNFQENVLLKNYSNYKIGGPAKYFCGIGSVEELKEALKLALEKKISKIFILGKGTNILINDKGFDGLIIYNQIGGINILDESIEVGSGVLIKDLLNFCVENSLTGFEWAGGLPGTVGGAVRGNAGAFKGEIKDNILQVRSLDLKTLEEKIRTGDVCSFGYRNSIFKSGIAENEFIASVNLDLVKGDREEIKEKIQQKIDYRINRHPMNYPSIGSTFKNIPLDSLSPELQKEFAFIVKTDPFPVVPVTKLLALSDLKGKRVGGAMISDKHPNFIVNVDNASSRDVKTLIDIARQAVKDKYGIILEEEIMYLN